MITSKTTYANRAVPLWVVLSVAVAAGCGTVGKGPDPDPTPDMSRGPDMAMSLCSAKSCAGCCDGDVCQQGITAAACGGGGIACVKCADAEMCGANLQCAFDPNAVWRVSSLSAQIAMSNPINMNKP